MYIYFVGTINFISRFYFIHDRRRFGYREICINKYTGWALVTPCFIESKLFF